jgi:hypothetical protein
MLKRPYLNLFVLVLISMSSMYGLVCIQKEKLNKPNGFKRLFSKMELQPLMKIKSNFRLTSFCGISNSHVYAMGKNQSEIIAMNLTSEKTMLYKNAIPSNPRINKAATIVVDSPKSKTYCYNLGAIFSSKLGSIAYDSTKLPIDIFTREAPISDNSVVIKGFPRNGKKQQIMKVNISNRTISNQLDLLKNDQLGFASDGFLKYDSTTKQIIFLQLFQNSFYSLDTNLKVIYISKTIDTISHNLMSTHTVSNDGRSKIVSNVPINPINKDCDLSNGYLFVMSGIKADNEDYDTFEQNSTIDIYDLKNGKYLKSFHIPSLEGENATAIRLLPKRSAIMALYKHDIVLYKYQDTEVFSHK